MVFAILKSDPKVRVVFAILKSETFVCNVEPASVVFAINAIKKMATTIRAQKNKNSKYKK